MRVENGILVDVIEEDINPDGSFTFPSEVTSIGDRAFESCRSLKRVEIPAGVTSIRNCTFLRCRSLEEIKIPEGVTSIGNMAFASCSSLKKIEIPEGVTFWNFYFF